MPYTLRTARVPQSQTATWNANDDLHASASGNKEIVTDSLLLYFRQVTDQEIVDSFAKAAKPRLMDLLKLKIRHVYETTPGTANSKTVIDGCEVQFKLIRSAQPYRDIERFVAETR